MEFLFNLFVYEDLISWILHVFQAHQRYQGATHPFEMSAGTNKSHENKSIDVEQYIQ